MNATTLRRAAPSHPINMSRTVDAVVATMKPYSVFDRQQGMRVNQVRDTDAVQLPTRVPILDNHRRDTSETVLGTAFNFRREADAIVASLSFAVDIGEIDDTWRKIVAGHLTQIELGTNHLREVLIQKGATKRIGSWTYTASNRPVLVVADWQIREVSIVAVGEDPSARIRLPRR